MSTLPLYDATGARTGELAVPAEVFGAKPNVAALHQVVVAELAAQRQGTHSTKTRGEVAGSGRKLWRQKGTGRARVGDRRPPHWRGGGGVGTPKPRDYRQRIPKRLKRESLRWALSARASAGEVAVLERLELPEAKTRALAGLLEAMQATGRTLLVTAGKDETVWRCGRNIPGLQIMDAAQITAYDVLAARKVIIAADALPVLKERLA